MVAPGHFVFGGRLTPEIAPEELWVPVAVIDFSARATVDPDAEVEVREREAVRTRMERTRRVTRQSSIQGRTGAAALRKGA